MASNTLQTIICRVFFVINVRMGIRDLLHTTLLPRKFNAYNALLFSSTANIKGLCSERIIVTNYIIVEMKHFH